MKGIEQIENIGTIRLCLHCGEPLSGQSKKYHPACGNIVKKIYEKARKQKHPERARMATAKYRNSRPKCTCCGRYPVAIGNRFLCGLCFVHDGDGWKELQREGANG